MNRRTVLALGLALALPGVAGAQGPPLPDIAPQYVVTYIEIAPPAADTATALLRTYRDAAREEHGAIMFEAFRSIGAPHHFAIVAHWRDTAAFTAHATAAPHRTFRTALAALLSAPYDERRHHTLNTAPATAAAGLVAITHVDIVPTEREAGVESGNILAGQSRGTPGNLRFDALVQSTRPNHMTFVERWADRAAYERHLVSPHLRAFRDALQPRSGSLYDERLYTALD